MNHIMLVAATVSFLTAGIGQEQSTDKSITSCVCVNLMSGSENVDIFIDDECAWRTLEYTKFSSSKPLTTGECEIQILFEGDELLRKKVKFETTNPQTLVLAGTVESPRIYTIENKPVKSAQETSEDDELEKPKVPIFLFNVCADMPKVDIDLGETTVTETGGLAIGKPLRRAVTLENHAIEVFDSDSNMVAAWAEFHPKKDHCYGIFFYAKPPEVFTDEDEEELEESVEYELLIVPHKFSARS